MSDFNGTWNVTINTPMGKQEGTLTLAQDGDSLGGTMAAQGDTAEIKNGKVDGDKASWAVDVTKPMPLTLTFNAEKVGDNLNGTVALGAFGNAEFSGVPA